MTKIDRSDEIIVPKTVNKDVGKAIATARMAKTPTMKQADLATKVNSHPSIIQSYENGTATPDQTLLSKMERVLGVKLRGSDIGSPLGPRGKKA